MHEEKYGKIIDCKYDYIISISLNKDSNIYYIGLTGRDDEYNYDLYINHQIFLQNIPYEKGVSINIVGKKNFIRFVNRDGNFGIIRDGKIIVEPVYKDVRACVQHNSYYGFQDKEKIEYLFIVSDGESYGICSPLGKLILPYDYSMIDMDEDLCIVLERKDNGEYEVGYYDSGKDIICHEAAEMKDGMVLLDDEGGYIWAGEFRYTKEE